MVEELLKLKDMLDKGIITKEEFAAAKEELAAKSRAVPLQRKPVSKSGFAPNSRPMHAPPKSSPKVQCPKCGEDMPTSRSYCDLCGAKLPKAELSSRPANVVKRRWYVLPLVLIACIVLVGFFVSDFQKGQLRKAWVEDLYNRTSIDEKPSNESSVSYLPTHTPVKTSYYSTTPDPTKSSSYGFLSDKEKEELYYVAKSFVKNHLLSPSKAKFALSYECDYGRGTGNVYNVVGWVESQNIYGATIRETWSCMMERNGDHVSLVMLDIGGNLYFE